MFSSFFDPLLIALVCSVIFFPLHRKVSKYISKGETRSARSAFVSLILVIIVVLTPLTFLAIEVSYEAKSVYDFLTIRNENVPILDYLNEKISVLSNKVIPESKSVVSKQVDVKDYIRQAMQVAFTHIDSIFSSAAKILFDIIILVLALFYFFKDGLILKNQLVKLSPLDDIQDEAILKKLGKAVNSIIRGTLMVAVIQGILSGLGFYLVGLPNAALWGGVAMFAALVPGFGTSLVFIPAVAFLAIKGSYSAAVVLVIWGGLAVGLIDNFLGPKLVSGGTGIHPLIILLSAVGGISVFGPIGFIAGPLIISFFFALMDVYKNHSLVNES